MSWGKKKDIREEVVRERVNSLVLGWLENVEWCKTVVIENAQMLGLTQLEQQVVLRTAGRMLASTVRHLGGGQLAVPTLSGIRLDMEFYAITHGIDREEGHADGH